MAQEMLFEDGSCLQICLFFYFLEYFVTVILDPLSSHFLVFWAFKDIRGVSIVSVRLANPTQILTFHQIQAIILVFLKKNSCRFWSNFLIFFVLVQFRQRGDPFVRKGEFIVNSWSCDKRYLSSFFAQKLVRFRPFLQPYFFACFSLGS